jgi:hypothetical protein
MDARRETKTAFNFGPELFVSARVDLEATRRWFIDVGATANVLFVREETSLVGVAGLMGSASLGARF